MYIYILYIHGNIAFLGIGSGHSICASGQARIEEIALSDCFEHDFGARAVRGLTMFSSGKNTVIRIVVNS